MPSLFFLYEQTSHLRLYGLISFSMFCRLIHLNLRLLQIPHLQLGRVLGLLKEHVEIILLHLFLVSDIRDSSILLPFEDNFCRKRLELLFYLACFEQEFSLRLISILLLNYLPNNFLLLSCR